MLCDSNTKFRSIWFQECGQIGELSHVRNAYLNQGQQVLRVSVLRTIAMHHLAGTISRVGCSCSETNLKIGLDADGRLTF